MSQQEISASIESLHARAEASYRSGDFEDARRAWNEILAIDPADERAREGLQLLSLVDPKWAVFEEVEQDAAGDPGERVEQLRARLRAGEVTEVVPEIEALLAGFPGNAEVEALAREARAAQELRARIDAALARGRAALASGDSAAAAAAAREALALAPGDREAERLLEEAEAALAPVAGEELPLDLELDLDAVAPAAPPGVATPEAAPPAGAPNPGTHLELDDPGELPVIPLAEPRPADPVPPPAEDQGPPAAEPRPTPSPASPGEEAGDPLEDLFEAARQLEEQVPVATPPAPGAEPPEPQPPAETGEAALLVARAREALDRGDTTEATRLAARALALDATLAEAEQVLEEARRRDEEKARRAEDLVGQAVQALDGGQPQLAIPLLRQVLELIPDHAEARELLSRAETAEAVLPPAPADGTIPPAGAVPPVESSPAPETVDVPPVGDPPPAPSTVGQAPPPPAEKPAAERPAEGGKATRTRRAGRVRLPAIPPRGLVAAALVLVLATGGVAAWRLGWLPVGNGDDAAAAAPVRRPARRKPARRAADEARKDAGDGDAAGAEEGGSAKPVAGTRAKQAAPVYAKKDVPRLVRQAERALAGGDEARAVELLEAARRADPLDFELVEKLEAARERLKERRDAEMRLARAKQAFRDGDWPEALRIFYRIPAPYRPAGIDRWIADGWYNLGIRELQAGDVVEARRYFNDCLELAPDDEAARRHREVALRYRGRPLDDAYWIYVRALEPRPLRE